MEPSRAAWLLDNKYNFELRFAYYHPTMKNSHSFEDGITPTEDTYINMVWSLMDETTSYHDALVVIAEG